MEQISLKLPESLHQQLLLKKQELGKNELSDTIRFLLIEALKKPSIIPTQSSTNKLERKAANYTIMAYCLIEKFLSASVKNGQILSDEAHQKAEKLINSLLQKSTLD